MIIDTTHIEPLRDDDVRDNADRDCKAGSPRRRRSVAVRARRECGNGREQTARRMIPAAHNLRALLSTWDSHSKGESNYWNAIIHACGTLHDATREHFDCLNLGHLEACLFAIRHAARNKS